LALVYNLIYSTPELKAVLDAELENLDAKLLKIGLKFKKGGFTRSDSIKSFLGIISQSKIAFGIKTGLNSTTGTIDSVTPMVEIDPGSAAELSLRPLYLADFRDELARILDNKKLRIWVMLDRLDEVFPHRSEVEKIGLRSLLKASYNFSQPNIRTKIFLRDDIIGYLAADGFTALTHVTDRSSSTMSWSKDELLHLIIKRVSAIEFLANHYAIDNKRIDNDKDYRESIFYKIFPPKIGKTYTMDWLYSSCADANNIVTPRDMIDFFKFAKAEEFKQNRLNPKSHDYLISEDTFKKALNELSVHKRDTFLFAEFPHLKDILFKFEGAYSEYNTESLKELIGPDYIKVLDDLRGIGFIKHIPKSGTYKIPLVWRKGLNVRRGKAYGKRAARKKNTL